MTNSLARFSTSMLVTAITTLVLTSLAMAASDTPVFKKGEDYGTVRTKMIKNGWKPFHAPDADKCEVGDSRCAGRPEMSSCAGTGMANCKFLWKKASRTVALCTVGEDRAVFDAVCGD